MFRFLDRSESRFQVPSRFALALMAKKSKVSLDATFVEETIAAYGSLEYFLLAITDHSAFRKLEFFVKYMDDHGLFIALYKGPQLVSRLLDDQRWTQLAQNPKVCKRELKLELDEINRQMRVIYGIQKHPPSEKSKRDQAIWTCKQENPRLTFGQIARRFEISAEAARSAWFRHSKRERAQSSGSLSGSSEAGSLCHRYSRRPIAYRPT